MDVGCASGYYSLRLDRRGAEVRAIDIHKERIGQTRFAAKIWGVSIKHGVLDLYDLPPKPKYDIVLLLAVLHHVKEQEKAIDIVSNLCKETLFLEGPRHERLVPYLKNYFSDVRVGYPMQGSLEPPFRWPLTKSDRAILICRGRL